MPKILLVLNGSLEEKEFCKEFFEEADLVVATDGAADHILEYGFTPDYLVGDMDSISMENFDKLREDPNVKIVKDTNQNRTDFEKAIGLINELAAKQLIILGAFGLDLDHVLANFFTLTQIRPDLETMLFDARCKVFLLRDEVVITGKKNDIVSVLPLGSLQGLSLTGLKWSLENKDVGFAWFGVRNRMLGEKAKITLRKGVALVMVHNALIVEE